MKTLPKYLKDGMRFECQGTGRCCVSREGYGYVYLNLEDRRRLARHLGISTRAFTLRYCEKTDGHFHLKEFKGPCQFLQGKGCAVYEARPNQCRTWPFWPENMNARIWNQEIQSFCPGVGKGRLYSPLEITELLKLDPISSSY
jgi:Fe-S-cluster containining protein